MADVRDGAPWGLYLSSQSIWPGRSPGAHRAHDVQVLPVRSWLARRAVSSRLFRRTGNVTGAGVDCFAEIRPRQARGTGMTRSILTAALLGAAAVSIASSQQAEVGAPLDPALFAFHRT